MIKGHTKIELTNVKTGEVQTVEDDNMITNGMAHVFEQTPILCGAIDQRNLSSLFSNNKKPSISDILCGGLLLFDTALEENVDNIMPPEGVTMVGNAVANISSAEDIPETGVFEKSETNYDYDNNKITVKYYYNFLQSQANGTIASVCLGSANSGEVGFGNKSGKYSKTLKFNNIKSQPTDFYGTIYNSSNKEFNERSYIIKPYIRGFNLQTMLTLQANYKKNYILFTPWYSFAYYGSDDSKNQAFIANGTLKLYKVYCPLSSVNPLSECIYQRSNDDETYFKNYQEIDVQIPTQISNMKSASSNQCYGVHVCCDGLNTYILFATDSYAIEKNAVFYVLKINDDFSTTLYTITNTSGHKLKGFDYTSSGNSNTYSFSGRAAVLNGYLYMIVYDGTSNNGRMFAKINLQNSADVKIIEAAEKSSYSSTEEDDIFVLGGRIFCPYKSDSNNHNIGIIDGDNIYPINGYGTYTKLMPVVGCKHLAILYNSRYSSSYNESSYATYFQFITNQYYLATINNLSSPVTKTADMIMKITYTLTCDMYEEKEGN